MILLKILYCHFISGHGSIVKKLITHNANINLFDIDGLTPLHISISRGQEGLSEYLITHHANVNVKDNDGSTPLQIAVEGGKESH